MYKKAFRPETLAEMIIDKRIYKTEMKFWTVLGSQGCREIKLPTAISMQLLGWFFQLFVGKKHF
jgi:hypothetical protein